MDDECDLRNLKRRLSWPTGVTRSEERASLILFPRWSGSTIFTMSLDARDLKTPRLCYHLGR